MYHTYKNNNTTSHNNGQEDPGSDRHSQRINLIQTNPQVSTKKSEKSKDSSKKCGLKNCVFCKDGTIPYLQNIYKPGWRESAIAAFKGILASDPSKGWLSLTDDIYPLFETHWDILCPSRKEKDDAWRKHLQDALSHNKKYFVSGKEVFGQTGYWRLRQLNDEDGAPPPAIASKNRTNKRVMSDEDSPEESTPIKRPVPSPAAPAVQHQGYLPNELEQMYIQQQQQQQQQHQMMAMNSFIPQQQQTQGIQRPVNVMAPVPPEVSVLPITDPTYLDLKTEVLLSKEFGWHFNNFLARAKIINNGSLPMTSMDPQNTMSPVPPPTTISQLTKTA